MVLMKITIDSLSSPKIIY